MKRAKVTIVGAGNVGATLAQALARTDLVDLSLIETAQAAGMAAGKALDIQQAGAVLGYSTRLTGGDDWALAAEAQVIVVTAGVSNVFWCFRGFVPFVLVQRPVSTVRRTDPCDRPPGGTYLNANVVFFVAVRHGSRCSFWRRRGL